MAASRFAGLIVLISILISVNASKIHPSLERSLRSKNNANVFVSLQHGSTAPLLRKLESSFRTASTTHEQRTTQVAEALKLHAQSSQAPILEFLKVNFPQVEVKSFWIINQVYLKNVNRGVIQTLAAVDLVSQIVEEATTHINQVFSGILEESSLTTRSPQDIEWALVNMRVPEVWNLTGNTGEGLIVGNIDTGVRGTHVLLKPKWVGLENLGWYDPEKHTSAPFDIYNHGTHTMGTLVGDDGIGIVPSAKWLACKGYRDNGGGLDSEFVECCEYMLCPFDTQGNNPDCTKAPHVVSNSWGSYGGNPVYTPAIHAWNTAGIVSSFSAGNEAILGCESIRSPADQPEIAAVGATDSNNALAYFSSLGPSYLGLMKPEISAPGVSIYSASAVSDTAMMRASGTSMSCPNASGVFALLKNQDRNLNQARAIDILQRTSRRNGPTTGRSCDGVSDTEYPNNHVGHGIIDALDAIKELL